MLSQPDVARVKRVAARNGPLLLLLLLSAYLGYRISRLWLVLLGGSLGSLLLLQYPGIGLFALIPGALAIPISVWVGAGVEINPTVVLIPVTFFSWLLSDAYHRTLTWPASRTHRPLILFLLAGLLSWLVGNALWKPAVPRPGHLPLVQAAQWGVFLLAALAYWLTANLITEKETLRRLTFLFLGLSGALIIPTVISRGRIELDPITTSAFSRAPLWMLIAALALGQLLFNQNLHLLWRLFLGLVLFSVSLYAFWFQRAAASNWIGVAGVSGVLIWLRWPRWRWPVLVLLVLLVISGALTTSLYEFAGGDAEWEESGGSRLALIGRVLEVTLHNPVTGLGPGVYRAYAGTKPLQYGRALWVNPQVNSHNNYVDLFAHTGLLGLGLFLWFMGEVCVLGWQLSHKYRSGFLGGYVSAATATCIASLVLMLLADWLLPYIYNIGFAGFQASALIWLFLGGLVAVDNFDGIEDGKIAAEEK